MKKLILIGFLLISVFSVSLAQGNPNQFPVQRNGDMTGKNLNRQQMMNPADMEKMKMNMVLKSLSDDQKEAFRNAMNGIKVQEKELLDKLRDRNTSFEDKQRLLNDLHDLKKKQIEIIETYLPDKYKERFHLVQENMQKQMKERKNKVEEKMRKDFERQQEIEKKKEEIKKRMIQNLKTNLLKLSQERKNYYLDKIFVAIQKNIEKVQNHPSAPQELKDKFILELEKLKEEFQELK